MVFDDERLYRKLIVWFPSDQLHQSVTLGLEFQVELKIDGPFLSQGFSIEPLVY